jgi:hypothetical protein
MIVAPTPAELLTRCEGVSDHRVTTGVGHRMPILQSVASGAAFAAHGVAPPARRSSLVLVTAMISAPAACAARGVAAPLLQVIAREMNKTIRFVSDVA